VSSYLGDFRVGKVVRKMWNSNAAAGESITRATNGTVSVYKDGGTTQSTTGVTDTEDFDSLTGVHLVAVDTSADGTFYSAGSDFEVVLSAATIDGKTVNATLFSFSLENRSPLMATADGRKLDVSAGGEAGVDWANVGGQGTTVNLSATTTNLVNTVTTYTGNTPQTGDAFARIGATGSGLTSLAPSATALSTAQWTNTRAGNLDNLDAAVTTRTLASAAYATAANQATVATTLAGMAGVGFDTATDSLEAIRNRGDTAWATATGFSTHSAADVWAAGTRTLTAFAFTVATSANATETAIKAVTDKLDTALEQDGATYRYTVNALELAPTGGSAPTATQIADAVLARGPNNVEDTAEAGSLCDLLFGTFESSISGTIWTIRKSGGATLRTKTITATAGADPITGVT
jgi:hypothetical protein